MSRLKTVAIKKAKSFFEKDFEKLQKFWKF